MRVPATPWICIATFLCCYEVTDHHDVPLQICKLATTTDSRDENARRGAKLISWSSVYPDFSYLTEQAERENRLYCNLVCIESTKHSLCGCMLTRYVPLHIYHFIVIKLGRRMSCQTFGDSLERTARLPVTHLPFVCTCMV